MKATWKQECLVSDNKGMRKIKAECMLTSDRIGKTMSVIDTDTGTQFTFPLEQVLGYLKK